MWFRYWVLSFSVLLAASSHAIAADLIYASFSGDGGRIVTYDVSLANGSAISASASTFVNIPPGGEFGNAVRGIAFDSNGNLSVGISDPLSSFGWIRKYNASGVLQSTISNNLYIPQGLAADTSGNLYAANTIGIVNNVPVGRISKFDSSGAFLGTIGDSSNVKLPTGLAIDLSGNLYAADYDNTISKFNSSGDFLGKIGSSSYLNNPIGLATDSSGNVYAANSGDNTISKFNSSGDFLGKIGSSSYLSYPTGLAIDSSGNLYAANSINRTISKFDSSGQFVLSWSTGSVAPSYLAFHPVPEPSTYILGAIGALTIGVMTRRRLMSTT